MIALLFVGGCIFLLTGSWDASETEAATGCCGGGATLVVETTSGCCGGENPPIETVTGGEVDAWLAQKGGRNPASNYTCSSDACKGYGDAGKQYAHCPARGGTSNCTDCSRVSRGGYCDSGCNHSHEKCRRKGCLHAPQRGGCSKANGAGPPCVSGCKGK